jgi:hypothetical protein
MATPFLRDVVNLAQEASDQDATRILLGEAAEMTLCERNFYKFLKAGWHVTNPHTPFVDGWQVKAICDHLQAWVEGKIKNLLIEVPPGTTKSRSACVYLPAWTWLSRPGAQWLFSSYAVRNTIRDSELCRLLIGSQWYQSRWGSVYHLSESQNEKMKFENNHFGVRECLPIGRTTGPRGDFLVIDDPNDVIGVLSDVTRTTTNQWAIQSWVNRTNSMKSGRLIIGQRTHMEDLQGFIRDKLPDMVILTLQEEFDPARRCVTPIFTDPRKVKGELLRPDMYNAEGLRVAKLNAFSWSSQFQQQPYITEGAHFKPAEWPRYVDSADMYGLGMKVGSGRLVQKRDCWRLTIVDPATSDRKDSDYTAILTADVTPDGDIMIVDVVREQLAIDRVVPRLAEVCRTYSPEWVGIEASAFMRALVVEAQRHPAIPEVKSLDHGSVSKLARAVTAILKGDNRKLHLPKATPEQQAELYPWLGDFVVELAAFTGMKGRDPHDDQVDCLSYLCKCVDQYMPEGELAMPMMLGDARRASGPGTPQLMEGFM